jgi:MYXO-CTERM domain-containing protein
MPSSTGSSGMLLAGLSFVGIGVMRRRNRRA